MNLVMFSRYGRLGASSRLRMFQYERYLRLEGVHAEKCPFFDDKYLVRLYAYQKVRARIAVAFLRRIRQLRSVGKTDLLWVEKEALPWMPWLLERALLPRGIPIVTDYDDATFHNYDLHRLPAIRYLLGKKIDAVMATATLVLAGNAYLAERARLSGARWVEIVPTVVDTSRYSIKPTGLSICAPRIGWCGTPSTWTEYMAPMMPLLAEIAESESARLMAVGAGKAAAANSFLDSLPWTEETEVSRIREMDIGIMPLVDTPWARGKCGYKLIQYMACGIPVIASPVGVNSEIVEHGVNGFLATSEAEWRQALVSLLRDPTLRRRMGIEGRRKVEAQYSLDVWGPRVTRFLKSAAERQLS